MTDDLTNRYPSMREPDAGSDRYPSMSNPKPGTPEAQDQDQAPASPTDPSLRSRYPSMDHGTDQPGKPPPADPQATPSTPADSSASAVEFPDGMAPSAEELATFHSEAEAAGLTDQAKEWVLRQHATLLQRDAAETLNEIKAWETESLERFDHGDLESARRAAETHGSPELLKLLNQTGLGNHPEVIDLFLRLGTRR